MMVITLDDYTTAVLEMPDGTQVKITLALTQKSGRAARIAVEAPQEVKIRIKK